jgi:type I restriction enzyme S subunit
MNPAQLLAHFDRITDAPDAIPRLRRLILDLAVRGKLVEQDPKDEPASELLKRIQAEKERLVKAGEIKKQEELPPIDLSEVPFDVPSSWRWIRIGSAAYVEMGQSPPSEHYNQSGDGIPFFQGKADFGVRHPTPRYWCTQPTKFAKAGDILISVRAPVGPTNVASEECCIGRGLAALRPHNGFDTEFLLQSLKSFASILESLGFGTTFVAINKKHLISFTIPLPSLAEQHRIVAKVDELMALCDRLEAAQTKRESQRDRLVAASLHRLDNGADAQSFREHVRFHLSHLPRLTTCPEQVQQLRQTILNLAVRGQLVPQDPNDEPVCKALEKARLENSRKWKEQSAKLGAKSGPSRVGKWASRYGELPVPNTQGLPPLPKSWEWVCWESILAFGEGSFKRGPFGSALTKGIFVASGYKVYEQYCPINDDCSFARYYITQQKFRELEGFAVKARDFLISCSGVTLGRITQVPDEYEEGIINQALLRVRINNQLVEDSFFKMLFRSPYFQQQIFSNSTGTAIPNVKGVKELKAIPLPLPPLAEQHRIVTKVEELMALCDRLEAQLTTAQTVSRRLLESVLHQALNPSI